KNREAAGQAAAAGPSPAARLKSIEALDTEVEKLKKDETELRQTITNVEKRLEGVPEREQEVARLTRDYQADQDLYDSLLKRYDEAKLAESRETGRQGEQFQILESAIPPESPVAPNRLRLMLMGLMMAAAAAVAAVLSAEQIDPSFHAVDELREFSNVPVL